MKHVILTFCLAALLIGCTNDKKAGESKTLTDSTGNLNDTSTTKPMVELDSATKMKNWEEYMTLSPIHKMMASWDGTWDSDITMWMPGAPEMKSKGTTVNKMIMNGLYQESDNTGNVMGMPFNGKSITAYDNHLKQFIATWIDNMGSGILVMHGTWDSTSKTINLAGTMVDPETKGECKERQTLKIVDENTQELEMFGPDRKTGQEVKTMHITYKRRK